MNQTFSRSNKNIFLGLLVIVCGVMAALTVLPATVNSQGSSASMTGWLWSDTIGWVDLNCANLSGCGTSNFGLSISGTGALSGKAWSENIGWISADSSDLSGCPTAPCTAQMSGTSMTGWMKALSANGNGWDGWISLSGAGYGPSLSGTAFSGYAWGSDVVGWLSFTADGTNGARTAWVPCASSNFCSGNASMHLDSLCNVTVNQSPCASGYTCVVATGLCTPPPSASGSITVSPKLVVSGDTATVTWSSQDATSCTVTGSNGDGTGSNSTGTWNTLTGSRTTSAVSRGVTYTLTCTNSIGTVTVVGSASVAVVPRWKEL